MQIGFSSSSYFSKCFKKEFGILPTEVFNSE
ncbi:AraC family transcriptional regulator [Kordia sp.]